MDIIKTTQEEGIKFPFKDKDWGQTFGVYCILTAIPIFVLIFGGISFVFPIIGVLAILFVLLLSPIFILIDIYLKGYILQLIKNVKEKKEIEIPRHEDIKGLLRLGLIKLIIELGPIFLSIFLTLISIGTITIGIILAINEQTALAIILILLGIIFFLITTIISLLLLTIILPAMIYIYLETNCLGSAYNINLIRKTVKIAWKDFLLLYVLSLIGGFLMSIAINIPCIGTISIPVFVAYIAFVIAFVTGKLYLNLKTKINLSTI